MGCRVRNRLRAIYSIVVLRLWESRPKRLLSVSQGEPRCSETTLAERDTPKNRLHIPLVYVTAARVAEGLERADPEGEASAVVVEARQTVPREQSGVERDLQRTK